MVSKIQTVRKLNDLSATCFARVSPTVVRFDLLE